MRILKLENCYDCPHLYMYTITQSLECSMQEKQLSYKDKKADDMMMELFTNCPLEKVEE